MDRLVHNDMRMPRFLRVRQFAFACVDARRILARARGTADDQAVTINMFVCVVCATGLSCTRGTTVGEIWRMEVEVFEMPACPRHRGYSHHPTAVIATTVFATLAAIAPVTFGTFCGFVFYRGAPPIHQSHAASAEALSSTPSLRIFEVWFGVFDGTPRASRMSRSRLSLRNVFCTNGFNDVSKSFVALVSWSNH